MSPTPATSLTSMNRRSRRCEGLDVWIVDALRYAPHPTHAHLERTLAWIERLKARRRAILTNLHIDLDYEALKAGVALAGVEPAYDGFRFEHGTAWRFSVISKPLNPARFPRVRKRQQRPGDPCGDSRPCVVGGAAAAGQQQPDGVECWRSRRRMTSRRSAYSDPGRS